MALFWLGQALNESCAINRVGCTHRPGPTATCLRPHNGGIKTRVVTGKPGQSVTGWETADAILLSQPLTPRSPPSCLPTPPCLCSILPARYLMPAARHRQPVGALKRKRFSVMGAGSGRLSTPAHLASPVGSCSPGSGHRRLLDPTEAGLECLLCPLCSLVTGHDHSLVHWSWGCLHRALSGHLCSGQNQEDTGLLGSRGTSAGQVGQPGSEGVAWLSAWWP